MNFEDELDQQINDALHTIRNAAPPQGMQARVLRNARQVPARRSLLFRAPILKVASVACAVAVTAGIAIGKHNTAVKLGDAKHTLTVSVRDTPASATPTTAEENASNAANATPQSRRPTIFAARSTPQISSTVKASGSEQDPAYAEMLAPSHPAPEMPLTQQEKLLLAAAKQQEPKNEVAELRRPVWPLHDPLDDDDFQQFFSRPPSPHQPGDSE